MGETLRGARLPTVAACLALALACTDAQDNFTRPGEFSSPHDVAVFGEGCVLVGNATEPAPGTTCQVFVISAEEDELNVLDVTETPYQWVRAPNPLRPLAIPVLDAPSRLTEDVRYSRPGRNDNTVEEKGPYLYASNPALAEISVIGTTNDRLAEADRLREVRRLRTEGPVSALWSFGAGRAGEVSVLYYAVSVATGAQVYRLELPVVGLAAATLTPTLVFDLPGETVGALAFVQDLQPFDDERTYLAVSTRADGGRTGRNFIVNTASGVERPLGFPGPVRELRPNPAPNATGRSLWGLLDEQFCGGPECGGLLAVNVSSGNLESPNGFPMKRVRHDSRTYPVTFTLIPNGRVRVSENDGTFAALGVVAYATGAIGFFDASGFIVLDGIAGRAAVTSLQYRDAAGGLIQSMDPARPGHGLRNLVVTDRITVTETIDIVYEGRIPGLIDVPLDPAAPVPTTFAVDPALLAPCTLPQGAESPLDANVCPRVRVNDRAVLAGGCTAELTVLSVDPAGSFTVAAPPEGCSGASSYTVRAGTHRPLVVTGSASGYLGRAALQPVPVAEEADLQFRAYRPYFHNPVPDHDPLIGFLGAARPNPNPTPNPDPQAPQPVAAPELQRDFRYVITTVGAFEPQFILIPEQNPGTGSYRNAQPGGLAYVHKSLSLFVSLPAPRQLLEFNTEILDLNQFNYGPATYQ